jgi:hypothetical protein
MNRRQVVPTGCFPALGQRFSNLGQLFLAVCAVTVLAITCPGCGDSPGKPAPGVGPRADLPDISAFLKKPSDRFLVDRKEVSHGHPFLGVRSAHPHAGAHVHFDNTRNRWPRGKDEPGNYPAVYAVADGTIGRLTTRFPLNGGNHRYGFDLAFARDRTGSTCWFSYSIEPMCPEPSRGFYKKFILVREGQKVRKGDVLAHLYTPPSRGDGCHIHFHLMVDGKKAFLAPAIFTPEVVKAFHKQCRGLREHNDGTPIPPCMGYRIGAEENPFGGVAKDEL